jgi:hypothetical protein
MAVKIFNYVIYSFFLPDCCFSHTFSFFYSYFYSLSPFKFLSPQCLIWWKEFKSKSSSHV